MMDPDLRGLAEQPEQWALSSFLHYTTGVPETVEVYRHGVRARDLAVANGPHLRSEMWGTPLLLGGDETWATRLLSSMRIVYMAVINYLANPRTQSLHVELAPPEMFAIIVE